MAGTLGRSWYGRGVSGRAQRSVPTGGMARAGSGGEPEALAVGGRAHADTPVKGTAQDLGAGEPRGAGDGLERLGAVLEQHPRALDAQCLDVGGRRLADLGAER